ncbi:ROK family transcriptional regulator [Deinococcus pimensis]|uniref:ROK family transcriptional regulator n=1 Tax=Deinococcus pimensis TaxID=309888 RepID=UPI0004B86417|nr:ROK family transcriptional regulator [Deinococcus pimensis]
MTHDVLDLAAIRAQHTLMLLRELWREDVSRAELSRRLGLSRSAISSIVAELQDVGLVHEAGKQTDRPGVGRRATMLTLDAGAALLVGVDLGARHVRVALLDLRCRILDVEERPLDIALGPQHVYGRVDELVRLVLDRHGVEDGRVAMIGVGIPGPVDHHTGRVVRPPNMPGWDDEHVARELSRRYHVPVHVDNDANLGALAEWRFGQHRGTNDLIYVKAAAGIGAGILLGGRLYRGARGGAGEIGHISINEMGPRGRSGNPGSLESYAAAHTILASMRERLRGVRTALTRESSIGDLLRLAHEDPLAREIWQDTGRHLGVAITTVLNLFNPAAVVIGGQLAGAGAPLLDAIREVVRERALLISRDSVHVSLSHLGPDVGVLGAGALLLEELLTPRGLRHLYRVASRDGAPRAPPALTPDRPERRHGALVGATLEREEV